MTFWIINYGVFSLWRATLILGVKLILVASVY